LELQLQFVAADHVKVCVHLIMQFEQISNCNCNLCNSNNTHNKIKKTNKFFKNKKQTNIKPKI